jgi:gas vesicle protein
MSAIENLDYEPRSGDAVDDQASGRALLYLLAGIGIGAGLALLLTPRRGNEVRDAIGRGYRRSIESLGEQAQNLRDRAQDLGEGLRQRGSNLLHFRERG